MKRISLHFLACAVIFVCAGFSTELYAGWFDFDETIRVPEIQSPNSGKPVSKNTATIHVVKFADSRAGLPPKNIGISTERIIGITGKNLVLDREVADVVTSAIKKRFEDSGFQFVEDGSAIYELSGAIKELTYNVKARDEISISLAATLKEIATGKVVWLGVVEENDSRFAGVSGNSKSDIAGYLQRKLGVVTKKTFDAISETLIAQRPELFNVAPGTKPISGVTVLFSPGANQAASGVVPVVSTVAPPKTGTLVLTTTPSRAKVYLEGVYFGMSPLNVEVEVGIHKVDVKLDGYKTASEKVSVRKDDKTELELVLEKP
jgi:hypothetical protein